MLFIDQFYLYINEFDIDFIPDYNDKNLNPI